MDNKLACRVCGMIQDEPPWGEDEQNPNHAICSCCGAEFGYEDCKITGIRKHRNQWLENGTKWFRPQRLPENWSLEEQMKNIPEEFR